MSFQQNSKKGYIIHFWGGQIYHTVNPKEQTLSIMIKTIGVIYKSKHYLLWTIQDMVELFNIENLLEKVSYYEVQQIIKNVKHLFKIGESKDDEM